MIWDILDGDFLHFRRLQTAGDWKNFYSLIADAEIYEIALALGFIPKLDELRSLVEDGTVCIWELTQHGKTTPCGYAVHSLYTSEHDIYVYAAGGFDPKITEDGLETLATVVFARYADAERVFTALPIPEPEGGEAVILGLGYEPWVHDVTPNQKRTFGLERSTYDVYHDVSAAH
jgi:hypothetical protein